MFLVCDLISDFGKLSIVEFTMSRWQAIVASPVGENVDFWCWWQVVVLVVLLVALGAGFSCGCCFVCCWAPFSSFGLGNTLLWGLVFLTPGMSYSVMTNKVVKQMLGWAFF